MNKQDINNSTWEQEVVVSNNGWLSKDLTEILWKLESILGSDIDLTNPEVREQLSLFNWNFLQALSAQQNAINECSWDLWPNSAKFTLVNGLGSVYIFISESDLQFVNKKWERGFDSVLSLDEWIIATKHKWLVVLENLETWKFVEWEEDKYSLINRETYLEKVIELK